MAFIYLITNIVTQKKYVGKTQRSIPIRWDEHVKTAQKNIKYPLYSAMRKYGIGNFSISVLEECDNQIIDEREKFFIRKLMTRTYENGYNMTEGGDGTIGFKHLPKTRIGNLNPFFGRRHSKKTKQKIKEKLIAFNATRRRPAASKQSLTPEQKAANRQIGIEKRKTHWTQYGHPRTGTTHSAESRQKMKDAHLGKKLSSEHKNRIGDSQRGIPKGPFSVEHRSKLSKSASNRRHEPRAQPIIRSDGKCFQSISEAKSSVYTTNSKLIIDCCKGSRSQAYGFSWKFK